MKHHSPMAYISSLQKNKEPEPVIPEDFRKALTVAPKANTKWDDLTPIARRDFVSWIEGAKQAETRKRRIHRACDMLAKGKRRPCCYAIVPMDLYKALGAHPKAKAKWKDLTPTERRDFVSWIDEAKQTEATKNRIEKVCSMIEKGIRHP
jgi:uncharacterized protein YdeI (YjbR/CyaY-like superfamily)